jgi:hypothetical protein
VLPTHAAVTATAAAILMTGCGGAPTTSPPTVTGRPPAPPISTAEQPSAAVPAGPTSWTMPNLVGADLQEAQDAIQRLTDFAIPITYSDDETGDGAVAGPRPELEGVHADTRRRRDDQPEHAYRVRGRQARGRLLSGRGPTAHQGAALLAASAVLGEQPHRLRVNATRRCWLVLVAFSLSPLFGRALLRWMRRSPRCLEVLPPDSAELAGAATGDHGQPEQQVQSGSVDHASVRIAAASAAVGGSASVCCGEGAPASAASLTPRCRHRTVRSSEALRMKWTLP